MIVGIEPSNFAESTAETTEFASFVGNRVQLQTLHENTWSVSLMVVPQMTTTSFLHIKHVTKTLIQTQPLTTETTPVRVLSTERVGKR